MFNFRLLPMLIILFCSIINECSAQNNQTKTKEFITNSVKNNTAKDFVTNFIGKVLVVLSNVNNRVNTKENKEIQYKKFQIIVSNALYLDKMAKYVAGTHWRKGLKKYNNYVELFRESVLINYANQFRKYAGEKIKIKSVRAHDNGNVVVKGEIVTADSQKHVIIWVVRKVLPDNTSNKKQWRITDIKIKNVSMLITLRSEYNSLIQSMGIENFLENLKNQIKQGKKNYYADTVEVDKDLNENPDAVDANKTLNEISTDFTNNNNESSSNKSRRDN